MANGIFTLKQQLQGSIQKVWNSPVPTSTYYGNFGSGQYLTVADATALNLSGGSYTLEAWIYPTGNYSNYNTLIAKRSTTTTTNCAWEVYLRISTGVLSFYNGTNYESSVTPTPNVWSHVAAVYDGTNINLYLNGNRVLQSAITNTNYSASVYVGTFPTYTEQFLGQISNVRIVKGYALYSGTQFSIPSVPLTNITGTSLLTLQNSSIVDNSSNAFSITNTGSVTTTQTTSLTNPLYTISPPAVEYLVVAGGGGGGRRAGGGGGAGGLIQGFTPVTSGTPLTITVGTGGAGATGDSSAGSTGNPSVFYNVSTKGGGGGASYGASSSTGGSGGGGSSCFVPYFCGSQGTFGQGYAGGKGTNFCGGTDFDAGGGGGAGTVGLNGTKSRAGNGGSGIASVISGTLTGYAGGGGGGDYAGSAGSGGFGGGGSGGLPTPCSGSVNSGGGGGGSGYTCAGVNGGSGGSGIVIISYPDTYNAPSALTGTYTASTSGSGSLYLQSSSGFISFASNSNLASSTNSFTLEFWYNSTATGNGRVMGNGTGGSYGTNNWVFASNASTAGKLEFAVYNYSSSVSMLFSNSSTVASDGQWHHIVLVRSGNTWAMFIDGTRQGSSITSSVSFNGTSSAFDVGWSNISGDVTGFNGYLSNIRFVNGSAVYDPTQTTLVVPTSPLLPIANTQLLLSTVSGSPFLDKSTNSFSPTATGSPVWNQSSPFATGLGYKNRVYKFTGSGTVTF